MVRKLWRKLVGWFRRKKVVRPLAPPKSGYRYVVRSDRGKGLMLAVETDSGSIARKRYEEELRSGYGDVEFWDYDDLRGARRR